MEMFIDGAWSPATNGARQDVTAPTTGEVFDTVPTGDAADADIAIQAAARAFETWKQVPMVERVRIQKALSLIHI